MKEEQILKARMEKHFDELQWLYMELYNDRGMFSELCENIEHFYSERNHQLKKMDLERESRQDWYRQNDML